MFQVKICGITRALDATAAVAAGADAIGLNFYRLSRRFIDPRQAAEIVSVLPSAAAKVGVFVNSPVAEVRQIAAALRLDFVQLHGDEPPEAVAQLADLRVIRAFRLSADGTTPHGDYLDRCRRLNALPCAVLFDGFQPGEYGGTGRATDWHRVRQFHELLWEMPLILAGGLTSDNVAEAIESARPDAVDTASGVESAPGMKDGGKMAAFVRAARRAFSS